MKRRMILATVVMAALLVGMMGISGLMGAMSASAEAGGSDDLEFTYLISPGRVLDNPLCDQGAPALQGMPGGSFARCPNMAMAANGDTIEILGAGTLAVDADDGEPEDVDGGGTFTHNFAAGGSESGTWEAKELLMFDSYGTCPLCDPAWRAGRALILVHLEYDGGMEADAILELGCRLNDPGLPGGGIPGTIEGIRLLISGGQNFNMESDPRATLFIDITDEDDD